ncbi:MAG: AAA family ATPase [Desulfosalsimonas sp.]
MTLPEGRIIAFTGTHGTGKTTAVYREAARLCMKHPGRRIGVVLETASQCPFPINKQGSKLSQQWIFHTHISRELDALQHYDTIVSDRTCVDAIAYTWVLGFHALALAMQNIAAHHLAHYQRIIFRQAKNNPYCHEAPHRETTDAMYRAEVESELECLYNRLGAMELIEYV